MRNDIKILYQQVREGNFRAIARAITIVENELDGHEDLLLQLAENRHARIVGITGPPGAGKSTLVNALLTHWLKENKKIAVIAVDPSSPFNYGALLGDRIRMSEYYTHPNIFIRSLATRGALGGLNSRIIEITDVVKEAPFDIVLVETVGVGQSEVEIAGLADCTVVTLVPEAGDEVQTLKAGIMEIANIFVVNKADRDGAEGLYRNLRILAHERANGGAETPVVKTIATEQKGLQELAAEITAYLAAQNAVPEKRVHLLAEKCWQLVQAQRMKGISMADIREGIADAISRPDFNLYAFTRRYL
ncbi:methylmalonyl Co-A mutase-associated GTPase MeaB [Nemorincola caseinilytica]|uniref:Methylmalonyl Co-A mutase-associated GTPase MeaB n=1 Tax=Nemorincola caseinilytica TaxID=2054315 RepID=A0ABP8N9Q2_9BACT